MVPVCSWQWSREVVQERLVRCDRALSDASGAVHEVGTCLKNTVPVLFVTSEPGTEWHIFHDVQYSLLDAGLDPTIGWRRSSWYGHPSEMLRVSECVSMIFITPHLFRHDYGCGIDAIDKWCSKKNLVNQLSLLSHVKTTHALVKPSGETSMLVNRRVPWGPIVVPAARAAVAKESKQEKENILRNKCYGRGNTYETSARNKQRALGGRWGRSGYKESLCFIQFTVGGGNI
jgi:hypothetical protein